MRRVDRTLCGAARVRLGLAACGGGDDGGGGGSSTITVDGSSTVAPFMTDAAERFQSENADVRVTVGVLGTGGGFERFCRGETDISDASRPIDDDEAQICADNGIEYVDFQVANDALTVVANPENDWADCLTVEQLKQIWEPSSDDLELEPGRPAVPGRGARPLRPWHRLGHVRLLHRRDQRRGGREPLRLHRERERQRARPRRCRPEGRARVLRLLLLRREPGPAEGDRRERRQRVRRAERPDRAGRHVHAALAPALHLREAGVARRQRAT